MGMFSWWFSSFISSIQPLSNFTMNFDNTLTGGNSRDSLSGIDLDYGSTNFSGTLKTSVNTLEDFAINPANGLPMVGGHGGVDIEGNPFGTDFSHDHISASYSSDHLSSNSGLDQSSGCSLSIF